MIKIFLINEGWFDGHEVVKCEKQGYYAAEHGDDDWDTQSALSKIYNLEDNLGKGLINEFLNVPICSSIN